VLYESYDELPNRPRGQFFRFPLGPLNLFEQHPFADQAFEHDGGELIGALENQLHFYLLVDGTGKRINEGPIKVVGDALKTSGTNEIVNGVSCMACHKHGIIPFQDELRDRSAVFGQADVKLRELVPPQAEWDRLQRKDADAYLQALAKATLPLWVEPGAPAPDIRDLPEPVGPVARQYRLGYLDVDSIAAELDLPSAASLAIIGGAKLKRLGLGGLLGPDGALNQSGVISRNDWEAVNGVSLMQSVAKELRASPVREL
jgi:serine/threonine-protein kinase